MRKRLLRPIALSLLWLCIGLSCKKGEVGPRTCDDGTCCGVDKIRFYYEKGISNEPVDLVADSQGYITKLVFRNNLAEPTWLWPLTEAGICGLSYGKVANLKPTAEVKEPFTYKYRIWGYVYGADVHTQTSKPISLIYITRIE
jgi:hypothetical protein